jgi:hypothetical protein
MRVPRPIDRGTTQTLRTAQLLNSAADEFAIGGVVVIAFSLDSS